MSHFVNKILILHKFSDDIYVFNLFIYDIVKILKIEKVQRNIQYREDTISSGQLVSAIRT